MDQKAHQDNLVDVESLAVRVSVVNQDHQVNLVAKDQVGYKGLEERLGLQGQEENLDREVN